MGFLVFDNQGRLKTVGQQGATGSSGLSGAAGLSIPSIDADEVNVWPSFSGSLSSLGGITSPEVPIVLNNDTIIDTNFGEVIPESLEISGGVQLEIADGARLEITGQVSSINPANIGQAVASTPAIIATSIPLTTFRNFAYRHIFNTTAVNIGWAPATTGTPTFVLDSRGNWERITAASGATNPSALTDTTNFLRLENVPELLIHFRLGSDITNQRFWIGWWDGVGSNADVSTLHGCGIRYSTVAGDTGFVLQSSDTVSQSLGSTLGTIVASDEYWIHLVVSNGGLTLTVSLAQLSTGLVSTSSISVLRAALGQNCFAGQIRLINQAVGTRFFDYERISVYWGIQMVPIPL